MCAVILHKSKGAVAIGQAQQTDISAEGCYRRFLAGDEDAFTQLVGLYRQGLTRYIRALVGDPHEAEGLMIDAFAQLAFKRGQFMGASSLKTYLYAIGRRLALRHLRRNRRALPLRQLEDAQPSPEAAYVESERKRSLYQAIDALPKDYAEVLMLVYIEGMRYEDAGQIMKKNAKQIDNLAFRAKAQLRAKLESEGFAYDERP